MVQKKFLHTFPGRFSMPTELTRSFSQQKRVGGDKARIDITLFTNRLVLLSGASKMLAIASLRCHMLSSIKIYC